MGQHNSLPGKGGGIPPMTPAVDNLDNSHPFSTNQNTGQDHTASSNPPSAVNNASSIVGGVEQAQSVRAAIDSFIETCLAGSDEGPPSPKAGQGRRTPSSVEVITVPDEDESDGVSVDGVDKVHASGGNGGKDSSNVKMCEEQQAKDGTLSDKVTDSAAEKTTESTPVGDAGGSLGDKLDKESSPQSLSVTVPKKDPASDGTETSSVPFSKPSQNASGASEKAISSSSREGNVSSHPNEGAHSCLEGMESMRLKTIIDRMLDSSLGGGSEMSSAPSEQHVLPQIMVNDHSEATNSTQQQSDKIRKSEAVGSSASGSVARPPNSTADPMAICFMDHIEKAVERSFSTITEEEERKEKEKVLAVPLTGSTTKMVDSKSSAWSIRTSKASDTTPSAVSGGDGTISVQDIVDRVITQTEVVAKQPLPSQHSDSKPTVSASGTFYPDKPSVDSASHSSQRRDAHKEEVPRETVGRRGRPRMRSPCPERREPVAAPEYLHGPRDLVRRGPGVMPGEDYLQSMQAALAKYGTVHPSHRMAPFLPAAMPTSVALTKGGLPVTASQSAFMMGGLHASPGSLQSRLHSPQHAALASQPPPLLRVDVMERGDLSHGGQPKPPPTSHPPSRSCMCSACSVYWAREAERVRMVQHQHQQPSPVDRGMPRVPSQPHHPPHPVYSKPMPAPSHSHKWPLEGRHHDAKQEKPHPHYPYPLGQEAYPTGHPAYGIQTGVPVPQMAYAEKHAPEARHVDTHYHKPFDTVEYAHRQTKPETVVREMGPGRHVYPVSVSSAKPPLAPSHSQALPHAHPSSHAVAGRKPDGPLLDLSCRKDTAPPGLTHGEEEKPLDLSSKKPAPPAYYERVDVRHRGEGEHRYDVGEVGVDHAHHSGLLTDRGREGEKYMSASQHLHNLETSVETHFQKLQHPGHRGVVPLHSMPVTATPPAFSTGMPPHGTSPVGPPQTVSMGRPQGNAGHGNSVPLPPHHPTLPPPHTGSASGAIQRGYSPSFQPVPAYPTEPLLSPGGRRPQLHPIPPPNPSTTLGSAPLRSTPAFQSRTGSSSVHGSSAVPLVPGGSIAAGTSAVVSGLPGATSPVVSLPSSMPRSTPPCVPVSSPQRSGSGGITQFPMDYQHLGSSRSVSPPVSSERGEDRQRGNSVSKHEPIHSILGNNNPHDILYLICRLCRQTYGSPYGFRKHFRNQHGFEPKAEHALVQTISATKNARQISGPSGEVTPMPEPESPSQDSHIRPSRTSSVEGAAYPPSHPSSPRPDMVRSMVTASPGSASCESMSDAHSAEGISTAEHRHRNSFSRTSMDSKGRSPSGGSVGEEREDTKCLECPECGLTFQLNDFGSYKRHCRQHSHMKGVGREGGSRQGVYSCTDCPCSYAESHLLQEHVQRHHTTVTPVTCPVCRTSFSSSADYQDHMRTVHNSSSHEATSSSSPVTVSDRAKVSSASSNCDISSSSTAVKREAPSTSLTNSASSFNLTVTTPSDLEICRLPADPIVTSASPDSSSDNKKAQDNTADGKKVQDSSPVSSSEQVKMDLGKTESSSVDSPKSGSSDGTDTARTTVEGKDSVKIDMDNKQLNSEGSNRKCNPVSVGGSSNSSQDADDNMDLFMYKHKKFSAHRKRSSSSVSETSASEAKQACVDVNSAKLEKTQQSVVSSATEKVQTKGQDTKSKTVTEEAKQKTTPSRTEARHPLPFVWDRVTRSQAGKNARSSDCS
ncbi:uncharacterized protein LOC143290534 [Babylonia areolata]|uniref:uncharacterized protein LOC143290534 n=1 Tax=Babylonia areolata TaxID=304850 RepID=UPI003FD27E2C